MKKLGLILLIICFSTGLFFTGSLSAKTSLKIAFLPIIDILPYYIADSSGYFKDENVDVKALIVANPVSRNRLMQSGEIHGMLNELSTLALFNRDKINLKGVMTIRKPMPGSPYFRIIAAPKSNITTVLDLKGVPIAVSKNTIIEYITDRILLSEGLSLKSIKTKNVPVIPERFQLLMKGKIKAATLPDPLAQAAIKAGAIPVIDDLAYPRFSLSVISFTNSLVKSNPMAITGFVKGWNRAVTDLNSNPESFRKLFLERIRVPENIQNTFKIPQFPLSQIPGKNQWQDVVDWLNDKKLLDHDPGYNKSVTAQFVQH
ncbi:MAG: ABC transporter substrate-binding protein [Desulfobacula sp.]|nr:ABC transporter substrate-binding protein [Desulfobacula sp.]